jgi:hypothetical protein
MERRASRAESVGEDLSAIADWETVAGLALCPLGDWTSAHEPQRRLEPRASHAPFIIALGVGAGGRFVIAMDLDALRLVPL